MLNMENMLAISKYYLKEDLNKEKIFKQLCIEKKRF